MCSVQSRDSSLITSLLQRDRILSNQDAQSKDPEGFLNKRTWVEADGSVSQLQMQYLARKVQKLTKMGFHLST